MTSIQMTNNRPVYIVIDQWLNVYWPIIGIVWNHYLVHTIGSFQFFFYKNESAFLKNICSSFSELVNSLKICKKN